METTFVGKPAVVDVDAAGAAVHKRYLVALVFARVGEEWLLLHDQCTPV